MPWPRKIAHAKPHERKKPMRPSGETFVKTLEVLKHCCEAEDRHALFIFAGRRPLEHAFHRAADMIHGQLGPFATIKGSELKIKFGNDSDVWFRPMEFVQELRWAGLKWTLIVEDNSIDWRNRPEQYRAAFAELGAYAKRWREK